MERIIDEDSFMPFGKWLPDLMSELENSISFDDESKKEKQFYALEI